ncbi:hypothetical protein CsSME_00037519 [Camellia sinensis var. sinensis]
MDRDGFLSCSCKKFEVKGIVCQHCLKVLREIINAKDLPAQYILKRWTKKARAETVKDRRGYDVKADVKLHQSDRYRSLMNMFRAIASRAAESEETYHLSLAKGEELSVMVEDKLSVHTFGQVEITEFRNSSANTCPQSDEVDCPIQAKGLKKRQATTKGRRRIKGGMEKYIAKKKRMQSKQGASFCTLEGQYEPPVAMGNIFSQDGSYSTYQGQSQPSSDMGNHSIQGVYTPQGQSRPPIAMGNISSQDGSYSTYQGQSQPSSDMGNHSIQVICNLGCLPLTCIDGVYTPQSQSRPPFAMGSNYVGGVYTSQGQSGSPSGMGRSNYVQGHGRESQSQLSFAMCHTNYAEGDGRATYISQPQSQSRPESQSQPSFAMGRTSVHHVMYPTYDGNNTPQSMPPDSMPLLYPTPTSFQKLLRDSTAVQLSQASHSPVDSRVDGHPWKACTER